MAADNNSTEVTQETLILHLRDIRVPDPVSWWPLAPGWWIIALLLMVWLVYAFWKRFVHKQSNQLNSTLTSIYNNFQHDGDTPAYAHSINRVMRELVYHSPNASSALALQGDRWVTWLEKYSDTPFTNETRSLLSDGCYRKQPPTPDRATHDEITSWIKRYARQHSKYANYSISIKPQSQVTSSA